LLTGFGGRTPDVSGERRYGADCSPGTRARASPGRRSPTRAEPDGGGQALGEPVDDGFMYMQAFRDLDGHQWSFIHMDLSAVLEQ
jgi:hypothetical protein